jgi:HME family heavy-metal exporter
MSAARRGWRTCAGCPWLHREGTAPVLLEQVAEVRFGAAFKRGDAGFNGAPAVIVSVQKQPGADSVRLTRRIEAALAALSTSCRRAWRRPRCRSARPTSSRPRSATCRGAARRRRAWSPSCCSLFLLNLRTTVISLTAIPLSLAVTALVFHALGLSINVMTLGGLAIAIGELVDDAVVDVENVLRRLRQQRPQGVSADGCA